MQRIKQAAMEIVKRVVFVVIPLAIALDPLQKWTNNKLATMAIVVVYVQASHASICWLRNRRRKVQKVQSKS